MKELTIERYEAPKVNLYKDGVLIGTINNETELSKVRLQIATKDLTGYYIIWKDVEYHINTFGRLKDWPSDLYSENINTIGNLFTIQLEKEKNKGNG